MDKLYKEALLFDFYGELLTEVQKVVFEEVVLNDYSLGEVALERGVSRQGIHDIVKRTRKSLEEYEAKLGLVSKFVSIKKDVEKIAKITDDKRIIDITQRIVEEL